MREKLSFFYVWEQDVATEDEGCVTRRDLAWIWKTKRKEKRRKEKTEVTTSSSQLKMKS